MYFRVISNFTALKSESDMHLNGKVSFRAIMSAAVKLIKAVCDVHPR